MKIFVDCLLKSSSWPKCSGVCTHFLLGEINPAKVSVVDDPFQRFRDELKALAHSARDQDRIGMTTSVSTDGQIRLDPLCASSLDSNAEWRCSSNLLLLGVCFKKSKNYFQCARDNLLNRLIRINGILSQVKWNDWHQFYLDWSKED